MGDGGLRYLTIRELARLQAFPDAWTFKGADDGAKMLQVGNAVPPPMAAVRDALAGAGNGVGVILSPRDREFVLG